MYMERTLGTRLMLLRRESGLRQEDLANISGVSQSYIANIERGRVTNVGIEYIFALAEALEVRVEHLLGLSEVVVDEPSPLALYEGKAIYVVEDEEEEEMIRELLRLFQRLGGADQRFALGLMRRMGGGDVPRVIGDE